MAGGDGMGCVGGLEWIGSTGVAGLEWIARQGMALRIGWVNGRRRWAFGHVWFFFILAIFTLAENLGTDGMACLGSCWCIRYHYFS